MANIMEKRNDVFNYQPVTSPISITTHGSDFYWAVTAIMFASTLGCFAVMLRVPRSDRIFHYITGLITFVAGVAYFSMASNLGLTSVPVEYQRSNPVVAGDAREVFYARYIDWLVEALPSYYFDRYLMLIVGLLQPL
jgi:bacteriorhodopsin